MYHYRKRPYNRYAVLVHQKRLLEQHCDYLKCNISQNILLCRGVLQPEGAECGYKIKIEYVAGNEPKTTIVSPAIEPNKYIHMYSDHSICLHYPPDLKWNERTKLYLFTVPWISEWIIFYEIYKVKKKWLGKESPVHIQERDKNINRNTD